MVKLGTALNHCRRRRFNEAFTRDEGGMPRTWTPRVDIAAITQAARGEAARSLALLALFRLDAPPAAVEAVQAAVISLLAERQVRICQGFAVVQNRWPPSNRLRDASRTSEQ